MCAHNCLLFLKHVTIAVTQVSSKPTPCKATTLITPISEWGLIVWDIDEGDTSLLYAMKLVPPKIYGALLIPTPSIENTIYSSTIH